MTPAPIAVESTAMFREAAASAAALRAQRANAPLLAALGRALRARPPRAVVTCARGSSDHAATFAKYLIETRTGVLTASAAPSVSSVYGARPRLVDCLFLAISQSGRSPDLIAALQAAAAAGATTLALVNAPDSPLAAAADHSLPLHAGPELSVAATKSYIASLGALVALVAAWTGDADLQAALAHAPSLLEQAWALDWRAALGPLTAASHLYVIGRGLGLAVAQELALKCKETAGLHAEGFSSAEVRHGPQALLDGRFGALLLAQHDATRPGIEQLGSDLAARGVQVLAAGASPRGATALPVIAADPAIEPLLLAQSGYRLVAELALARGHDPDRPPYLAKVTETR
ncbi:MAG TPA: SIS domain-containing protein [Steroidobacteraceae bacterium]|nr:SIS domain-containing protein [Steroidobacteraceae bacterium]